MGKTKDISGGGSWTSLFSQGSSKTVHDMYSGIVFKCIDLVASNVSTNKYYLQRVNGDNDVDHVTEHPALKLLKRPNRFQTSADLLYQISTHIDVAGVSYLYPVKSLDNSNYVELWALNPNKMKVVPNDKTMISHYEYKVKGKTERFEVGDIIEIKRPNPFNPIEGLSTIEKSRFEIEGVLNAITWNSKFFANGAMPSGILRTEQSLSDDSFRRLKEEYNANYAGKDNAGKLMLLDKGLTFEQMMLKQKDMDFMEQRKFSRDEILAMFGVPKGILYADDVNRANAEAAKYFFGEHTLSPRLDLIFEKLNVFYLPLFANSDKLEFVYESPVPENLDYSLQRKEKSVNRWLTINEVRAEDGYEPVDGGDILYFNINAVPVGEDTNTDNSGKKTLELRVKTSKNDKRYLAERRRYVAEQEEKAQKKYKAQLLMLVRLIKLHKNKALKTKANASEIVAELMPNLTEWQTLTAKITFDIGIETLERAASQTASRYDLPADFKLEHSGAISILQSRANATAKSVVDSTRSQAQSIIAEQLKKGDVTLDKIRKQLVEQLNMDTEWKAQRLARTEVLSAYSEGSMLIYKQSDNVTQLKWLSVSDACEICRPNNNVIIDKSGVFPSGHSNTPAHPNCRCEVIPYFTKQ